MITKEEYSQLCKACDKVLLHDNVTKEVVANSALHIVREHPSFLKSYQRVFGSSRASINIDNVRIFGRFTLISIFRITKSIFVKKFWYCEKDIEASDVLFVSHLINEKLFCQKNDFYFHDMPEKLEGLGISSSVALINHIKIKEYPVTKSPREKKSSYIVLNSILDFSSELKLYILQLKSIVQLKNIFTDVKISDRIAKRSLLFSLSSDTANTLRIAQQIALLVSKTKAKYLFVTYEGHAWERLVFHEARIINPKIKCIGYQHAVILEHQHAIRRLLDDSYNPDIILTAGKISETQLRKVSELSDIEIKCLGSSKSRKSVLRSEDDLFACLVVPEGLISECIILFEFSLICAKLMPEYKFVWRLHPLLSFSMLTKHSTIFRQLPSNIYLSNKTLEYDISQCDSVLYRGSTAVVEAIRAGLRPIYLAKDKEMPIDPIYEQLEGKSIVATVAEFSGVVENSLSESERIALSKYAQDFHTPINYSLLKEVCSS